MALADEFGAVKIPSGASGFNILEPKSNPSLENEFGRVKMKTTPSNSIWSHEIEFDSNGLESEAFEFNVLKSNSILFQYIEI